MQQDKHSLNSHSLKRLIEAALLTSTQPLGLDDLQRLFTEKIERSTLRMLLDEIRQSWLQAQPAASLELVQVASGWRFQAQPDLVPHLARLAPDRSPRLTRATAETLAIIAYRQPVTRGDIEKIRGVSLGSNIIQQLMERGWIDMIGHREVPGRPGLYATTRQFLDDVGLQSLDQLPPLDNLMTAPDQPLPDILRSSPDLFDTSAAQSAIIKET